MKIFLFVLYLDRVCVRRMTYFLTFLRMDVFFSSKEYKLLILISYDTAHFLLNNTLIKVCYNLGTYFGLM